MYVMKAYALNLIIDTIDINNDNTFLFETYYSNLKQIRKSLTI